MTNSTPTNLPENLQANFQKIKTEGGTRATRIGEIVKAAATQATAEIRAGKKELGAIAQDTIATVGQTVGTTFKASQSQSASQPSLATLTENATENSTESSTGAQTLFSQLLQTLKRRFLTAWQSRLTVLRHAYAESQPQRDRLNEKLTEKYGDRYTQAKQRLTKIVEWYTTAKANGETPISDVWHQKQTELETKVGAAGSQAAKTEQQIRQQLKSILQTTATKL